MNILTYANRNISRPLVIVLAGNHSFPDDFKSKLAFKAQHVAIQKPTALLIPIERCAWVTTTLFFYLCRGERKRGIGPNCFIVLSLSVKRQEKGVLARAQAQELGRQCTFIVDLKADRAHTLIRLEVQPHLMGYADYKVRYKAACQAGDKSTTKPEAHHKLFPCMQSDSFI